MDLGTITYILSFIKIGSVIQKLIGMKQTHRWHGDPTSKTFLQNTENRIKIQRKDVAFR
jgi:hypothetical protein